MDNTRVYFFTAGQQSVFMHVEIIRIYAFISKEYYVSRPSSHLRICHIVLHVTNARVRRSLVYISIVKGAQDVSFLMKMT